MQKIVPFLWFDGNAEEAINYYVSIFKNSKVLSIKRYEKGAPQPEGTVMVATQAEVDDLWERLSAGGEKSQCGWLKDKFGLSWQIIPTALGEMLSDKDPEKAARAMNAMLQMRKIDIAQLKQAQSAS